MDPVLLAGLAHGYVRRERWRARLQAVEIVRLLAGGGPAAGEGSVTPAGRAYRTVTPGALIQRIRGN